MIRRSVRAPTWTIPAWYAGLALLAALYLPRLESGLGLALDTGVDPASLLAMFSAVAGGMIALTGIVFSLAFVMVQFSATAYSPRLVLWIARDPLLWHAVGIFSATFLYSLGATAWIQHERVYGGVPFFSAWLVVGLLVASVAVFIALIEKLSLLQVHRMLGFTAATRLPTEGTAEKTPPTAATAADPASAACPPSRATRSPTGYRAADRYGIANTRRSSRCRSRAVARAVPAAPARSVRISAVAAVPISTMVTISQVRGTPPIPRTASTARPRAAGRSSSAAAPARHARPNRAA